MSAPRRPRPAHRPADPHAPIRLLIADDDPQVRAMLSIAFSDDNGIDIVGTAEDGSEAIALAGSTRPDVALIDVRMPAGGGPHATRGILAISPDTKVLAYSALDERETVVEMLRMGATGYLVKSIDPDRLPDAIRRTAAGEPIISEEVAASVFTELSERVRVEEEAERERDHLRAAIRRFVGGHRVSIVWQPVVDLATGEVAGAEALARFDSHPPLRPDIWILEAWKLGLGFELEMTLLELAADRLPRLPDGLFIAVNLSPSALLVDGFEKRAASLPWERIVLELTEHMPIEDYQALAEPLGLVRDRGGRLAVDDAGSGFASLRHIVELAPDLIKLDESVIRGLREDRRRHAMAVSLTSFAAELGCMVVAEGIEEGAELDTLRAIGVRYGQGKLLTGLPSDTEIDDALRLRIREALHLA